MSFSAVIKTIVFLGLLFVMLYVGMENTHTIDFHFPIAGTTAKAPIRAQASLIYFGVFAVGVLAGTLLHGGGGKGGGKKSGGGKEK
jgi:fucose permease